VLNFSSVRMRSRHLFSFCGAMWCYVVLQVVLLRGACRKW
jgi:hypothetical protein